MHDRLVDGRYRFLERLGSGGAADVWRVRDEQLGVDRALKLLNETEATRPTARRRLRAEADALARIAHPNVLRVLDLGSCEGRDYLVVELMPERSLGDRVVARGCLSPPEAIERIVEALAGLAAAHAAGIIHRDIKPTNLLIGSDGRTVIADFGIALLTHGDRRTRDGVSMGSFAFMPPEQRLDARSVGPSADLYAVGASLYWLITGRNPVDLFVAEADSERFASLDAALVDVLRRALSAEPADRYPTAGEMAQALLALAPDVAARRPDLSPTAFPEPLAATGTLDASDLPEPTADPQAPAADLSERKTVFWAIAAVLLVALLLLVVVPRGPSPSEAIDDVRPLADVIATGDETAQPSPDPVASAPASAAPRPDDPADSPPHDGDAQPVVAASKAPPLQALALPRRFKGTLGQYDGDLILDGPDEALRGTFAVRFGESVVESPVRGSYDPTDGRLQLRDLHDAPDAGRYDLRYDGARLRGSFIGRSREITLRVVLTPGSP